MIIAQTSSDWFEALWAKYPRRLGKKAALKHFKSSIKTMQDYLDIQKALYNFVEKIKKDRTEEQFIPHGSTWFNNWRDWVDYKEYQPRPLHMPTAKPATPQEEEIPDEDRQEILAMSQALKSKLKAKVMR